MTACVSCKCCRVTQSNAYLSRTRRLCRLPLHIKLHLQSRLTKHTTSVSQTQIKHTFLMTDGVTKEFMARHQSRSILQLVNVSFLFDWLSVMSRLIGAVQCSSQMSVPLSVDENQFTTSNKRRPIIFCVPNYCYYFFHTLSSSTHRVQGLG